MKHFKNMSIPYILWALAFIVAPFILIIIYAFTDSGSVINRGDILSG